MPRALAFCERRSLTHTHEPLCDRSISNGGSWAMSERKPISLTHSQGPKPLQSMPQGSTPLPHFCEVSSSPWPKLLPVQPEPLSSNEWPLTSRSPITHSRVCERVARSLKWSVSESGRLVSERAASLQSSHSASLQHFNKYSQSYCLISILCPFKNLLIK